jgi:hypothetical protein
MDENRPDVRMNSTESAKREQAHPPVAPGASKANTVISLRSMLVADLEVNMLAIQRINCFFS